MVADSVCLPVQMVRHTDCNLDARWHELSFWCFVSVAANEKYFPYNEIVMPKKSNRYGIFTRTSKIQYKLCSFIRPRGASIGVWQLSRPIFFPGDAVRHGDSECGISRRFTRYHPCYSKYHTKTQFPTGKCRVSFIPIAPFCRGKKDFLAPIHSAKMCSKYNNVQFCLTVGWRAQ